MKKIAVLIASVVIATGFSVRAFADETSESFKAEAGITPDSILYPIDLALDNLKITLASTDEKKAEAMEEIAQERLGESEVMTEEKKVDLANKALEEYNNTMIKAVDKLQTSLDKITDSSDDKLDQKVEELEKNIQETQEKSLKILSEIKDKVGEKASEVVDKVIEDQAAKKEAVANFVKERHQFNAAKKDLNMAKADLKKVEKSGDAEAVKKAEETLAQYQEAFNKEKAELQDAFQKKQQTVKKADKEDENKKDDTAKADIQTVQPINQVKSDSKDIVNTAEQIKTNNGNGNGKNIEKQDKKDKEKSDKEHGKSNEAKGKNK
ncbi:hypothetical protein HMPREF1982_04644 [Clostridiales bacterium oral taxon 876 str. F0540]|nr:hypothetical protein HMPREF1982_04644 [Clostridiales bacterium oral taxon 876 str. F0540]